MGKIKTIPLTWNVSHEMNHREPPHQAVGLRRALRYVSLLLLPTLAPKFVSGISESHPNLGAALDLRNGEPVLQPYLAIVGGPPLRFQNAPPPPDLTVRPAAGARSIPIVALVEAPPAPVESKLAPATAALAAITEFPAHAEPVTPAKAPPPSIITDDARPTIRPEDFLPYFQIPGQAGGVNVLVPVPRDALAPAPLPPSTATSTQSK